MGRRRSATSSPEIDVVVTSSPEINQMSHSGQCVGVGRPLMSWPSNGRCPSVAARAANRRRTRCPPRWARPRRGIDRRRGRNPIRCIPCPHLFAVAYRVGAGLCHRTRSSTAWDSPPPNTCVTFVDLRSWPPRTAARPALFASAAAAIAQDEDSLTALHALRDNGISVAVFRCVRL